MKSLCKLQISKKAHYVPQVYLRCFIDDKSCRSADSSSFHLSVFDKINKKQFSSNIKDIAEERFFYTLTQRDSVTLPEHIRDSIKKVQSKSNIVITDEIERKLSKIEGRYPLFYKEVVERVRNYRVKNPVPLLCENEKSMIIQYLIIQLLRSPKYRNVLQEINQERANIIKRNDSKNARNIEGANLLGVVDHVTEKDKEEAINLLKSSMMSKTQQLNKIFNLDIWKFYENIFSSHKLVIFNNKTRFPFFTSDTPVAITRDESKSKFSWRTCSLYYPLNNKLILVLLPKISKNKGLRDNSLMNLYKKDEQDVRQINMIQIDNACQYIYSSCDDFSLVKVWRRELDI